MTIVPSFLVTGILAVIVGIVNMIWAAFFVHRKRGGLILILLSIALLLVGGGLFPPIIGIIAGAIGTRINAPINWKPNPVIRFLARLWPWSLVVFFAWMIGQFAIGYFFNDFLVNTGFFIPFLILGLMALAIVSGFARDVERAAA
jgi:hypothetical protein